MSEVQSFKSLVSDLENTIEAETDNFFELAKIANLNPLTDFAGEDISQENLRCANLQGANLRETNLTESDLSYADLSYADLSYADLSYADLSYADLGFANLTNTDLTGANLQNTKFANNQGIDEKIRLKLIERGAVFNNQDTDPNIIAYEKLESDQKWFEKYQGKYVAFVEGTLVDSDEDNTALHQHLRQLEYLDKGRYITKVGENMEIIDLPSSLCLAY